ncbi:HET-domain-containing protein [Periconia macrospinosa]|uniref:HET-domain-containing protein n=1 Tax=Periconia macrospinosa TaxID=97972 RepID=A0A2V1DTT6_9PLEO|nr:HET-domain-containing protein [Periconia macrospinosa]
MSHGTPECVLELYSLSDDPAHELIETKPLTTFRGGDENLKIINSWLDECQKSHAFCKQRNSLQMPLPTRLLEIADDSTVHLIETGGQVGQYVALSYCWGPNPQNNSMTTISNVRDRLQPRSIRRNELPAAIADAITITESLGIKHIWVDALCMIQDSLEDKHGELSNMSKYYKNSFLTIAASTQSCTTGFIGTLGRCEKHPDSELPSDLVPLPIFAMNRDVDRGGQGTIYVREENPYQIFQEPINQRAWTMQEMILAPRVLMFGSRVMWFCQHMTHSDGGIEDWSFDDNEMERTRREFQIALSNLDRDTNDEEDSQEKKQPDNSDIYHLWHRIVGTYTRRSLTHAVDKFPAISAIAAEFARLSKSDYLAGLWRSNLIRDLLWTTSKPATHRPETWRAPTWSWASVDDAIFYESGPSEQATQLAKVERAEVIPVAPMVPFGEIERGRLAISAPFMRLNITKDNQKDISGMLLKDFSFKAGKSEREFLYEALRSKSFASNTHSEDEEKKEYELPEEIFVVFLYGERDKLLPSEDDEGSDKEKKSSSWMMWGLVLKRSADAAGEKQYERVMSFSRIRCNFEAWDKFESDKETFDLI